MPDLERIKGDLVSEVGLEPVQADVYLLLTTRGAMAPEGVARALGIGEKDAQGAASALVELGALIEVSGRFEAMHPRFTAVNMYRRARIQRGEDPGRNDAVDAIGAALEGPYDDARTGSND